MEEKGWQKNRLCLKHYKDLHLKPKLEFRSQNSLCVSIHFHLKTAVPIVSTGYSGVRDPLQKLTAFSIKEESQEHKNPGLSPILFFSLNGQQSKENVYRTKITKKKHSNGTEDGVATSGSARVPGGHRASVSPHLHLAGGAAGCLWAIF